MFVTCDLACSRIAAADSAGLSSLSALKSKPIDSGDLVERKVRTKGGPIDRIGVSRQCGTIFYDNVLAQGHGSTRLLDVPNRATKE